MRVFLIPGFEPVVLRQAGPERALLRQPSYKRFPTRFGFRIWIHNVCPHSLFFPLNLSDKGRSALPPGTTLRVLNLDNSIMAGGFFYSLETMTASCVGVLQSFANGLTFRHPERAVTSLNLLKRIVVYVHQHLFVFSTYDTKGCFFSFKKAFLG